MVGSALFEEPSPDFVRLRASGMKAKLQVGVKRGDHVVLA